MTLKKTPHHRAARWQAGSALPIVLSVLVLGTVLGVLFLLLFGNRNSGADTISTINTRTPGTTVVQKDGTAPQGASSQNTTGTNEGATAPEQGGSETSANTAQRGEGADISGSPASHPTQSGEAAPAKALEQTVVDTDFKGTGAEIYVQACQSCHMPGGAGAKGAGIYPALANNPKLKTAQYPISLVLFGNGGMPAFGHYMNDQQISDVVNYIRSELNQNTDKVTPDDIKKMRPSDPHYMIFGEAAG